MMNRLERATSPMNKGGFHRVLLALAVLLVASALMVGAVSAEGTPVAKIESGTSTFEFNTLEDAFNRAVSGDVITLLSDVTITIADDKQDTGTGIVISGSDLNLTLNLSGKTIYGTNGQDATLAFGVFDVLNGASLTINGPGKIDASDFYCAISVKDSGKLTINGGEYIGSTGGCIYTRNDTVRVTITDGTFSCAPYNEVYYVINQLDKEKNEDVFDITGGSFKGVDPSASNNENPVMNYLPAGYTVTSEEIDGATWYTVVPPVAEIAGTGYATLVDAFAAVTGAEKTTITLLQNANGDGIEVNTGNKDIVLDLGGFTYTVDGKLVGSKGYETQGFHFEKGNTILIKNGTLVVTSQSSLMVIQNYANLTLQDVTVDGSKLLHPGKAYTSSNNNGNVVYTGKTKIIARDGDVAFDVCYAASAGYPDVSVTIADKNVVIDGPVECGFWDETITEAEKEAFAKKQYLITPEGYVISDLDTSLLSPYQFYWKADGTGMQTLTLYVVADVTSPVGDSEKQENGAVKVTVVDETYNAEAKTVTTTSDGITAVITFTDVTGGSGTYTGNISTVDYGYADAPAVTPAGNEKIATPTAVTFTVNLTLVNATSYLPKMNATLNETVLEQVASEKPGYHPVAMVTAEDNVDKINANLTKTADGISITFTVPTKWVDAMGGKDSGRIVGFHAKDNGQVEILPAYVKKIDANTYAVTVTAKSFSTIGLAGTPAPVTPPKKEEPVSQGTSVWLEETPTQQPTQQPTATQTPTDTVPTDIPTTSKPTEEPSSPGFGVLAALAGLGAVAVLRRK